MAVLSRLKNPNIKNKTFIHDIQRCYLNIISELDRTESKYLKEYDDLSPQVESFSRNKVEQLYRVYMKNIENNINNSEIIIENLNSLLELFLSMYSQIHCLKQEMTE